VRESFIVRDLEQRRNMRLAFKDGFYVGGLKSLLLTLSRGKVPGGRIAMEPDAAVARRPERPQAAVTGELAISKLDAVFKSGNSTRDDIPSHLIAPAEAPPELAEFYQSMCPAGVYEREGDRLVVNAPNCIDCKATDVLGPRWTPREGGSGPKYRQM
jgi:electron-transferring-flavoprotein dehydrogenase